MSRIVRTETRKRGFFGHIFKWLFILFNAMMVVWLIAYFAQVGDVAGSATSDAERAGAAIGGTLGTGILVSFWAAGDIILGLFVLLTRGKKVIVEEAVQ